MSDEWKGEAVENVGEPSSVTVVGRGLVYALEDVVVLEVPALGRMDLPPAIAEKVAMALLEGAKLVREGRAKKLVRIML